MLRRKFTYLILEEFEDRLIRTVNTTILFYFSGPAGLKHPAIFGLYDLDTVLGSRPAYVRRISKQYMFYKEIYDKWDYDHIIER